MNELSQSNAVIERAAILARPSADFGLENNENDQYIANKKNCEKITTDQLYLSMAKKSDKYFLFFWP